MPRGLIAVGALVLSEGVLLLGPDRQHIPLPVGEMESLAAGEVERGHNDGAACRDYRVLRRLQVLGVKHDQRRTFRLLLVRLALPEAAIDAGVVAVKADVVRTV